MIRRVFELDPLLCPCGGSFRVVAFITEPRIVRKILDHLNANANRERAPPTPSISHEPFPVPSTISLCSAAPLDSSTLLHLVCVSMLERRTPSPTPFSPTAGTSFPDHTRLPSVEVPI
ncbi:MAG TPA: hypothetical protein VEK15_12800, partial [Vicinamibacteria bacterium]|nr:hypothetical protein [Vicinamibacteria bacterium]